MLQSMTSGWRVGLGLGLGSLALLGLVACSEGSADKTAKPVAEVVRTVSVAQVELRPMGGVQQASGLLVAREEIAIGPELSGYRVAALLADEGDQVRAGQPLARLDDGLLQAKIAQAQASLVQAKAQARQAQAESARVEGLDGQGVLSDEQIQQRRTAAASAQANADVAAANLAGLRVEAERMVLRAPVAGVVLQRNVRRGDVASPGGEAMFRLARDGMVELAAEVPEDQVDRIQPGNQVAVTLASGVELEGQVRLLSRRVDDKTKLAQVRVALPVRADLRPGGFAQARFAQAAAPVAAVPEKAIHFEAGGPQLATIDADSRIRKLPVSLGARAQGWVALRDGPPLGTRLALGGGAFVLEGDRVQIHGAAQPAAVPATPEAAPAPAPAPAAAAGGQR